MAKDVIFEFTSRAAVRVIAEGWREGILSGRTGGLMRVMRGKIEFRRPRDTGDPFDDLGQKPVYSVLADIPLGSMSNGRGVAIHLYLWEKNGEVLGRIVGVSGGMTTGGAVSKFFGLAVEGVRRVAPDLRPTTLSA